MTTDLLEKDRCGGCGQNLNYVVSGTLYSRAASIEVSGVYDGGLFYAHVPQTGGCGFAWHRWPEGNYLRQKADRYLVQWLERYYTNQDKV